MFERSGPTGLAPIAPALWHAMHAPLPMNTACPRLGSPGSSMDAACPPPDATAIGGTSSSLTSTVPPRLSRNATVAHTSLRFSPIGGFETLGMMLGNPSTT